MTPSLDDTLELLTDEALEQLDVWLHTLQTEGVTTGNLTEPLELILSAAVTLGGVSLGTLRLELNPDRQRRELIRAGASVHRKRVN